MVKGVALSDALPAGRLPGNTGNVMRRNASLISDGLKDDWGDWSGSSYRLMGDRVELNQ